MTNMKHTKRALLLSVLSLILCFSMMLGTTYAWFTDSVTSTGNKIQSGTLKVDLELYNGTDYASIKESKAPIFNYDKWEPGYVDVKLLKIENEGTLALKWKAMFVSDVALSDLANVIDVYVLPSETALTMPGRDLAGYTKVGTVAEFVNTIEDTTKGELEAGEVAYLGIALKMRETAGNEYQKLSIGAFDITVVATQLAYEKDSFDQTYDDTAEYSAVVYKTVTDTSVRHTIDTKKGVVVALPVGAPVGEYLVEVNNKSVQTNAANETTVSMDIELKKDGAKVTDDGSTIYEVEIEIGTGKRVIEVTHNNVSVDSSEYSYDEATGILTVYTSSFSPFSLTYDEKRTVTGLSGTGTEADPFLINDYYDLCWFRDHVNTCAQDGSSQYTGKVIKLTADIDLNGVVWEPIGSTIKDHGSFYGTFDGDGHTISNLYVELGKGQGAAGFFAKVSGGGDGPRAVVKNLVFENVDVYSPDSYVGGVIGNAGGNSEIRNVTVKGDVYVNGSGYVGGIVGHGYPDMYNCHVDANDGSYVICNYWCGGGLIGYAGEGNGVSYGTYLEGCSVKGLYISSSSGGAGALAGLLNERNYIKDCHAENVTIKSAFYYTGYACGAGRDSEYENVSVKNVSVKNASGTELNTVAFDGTAGCNWENEDLIVLD